MRKILAGFLATSMVVSMATMVSAVTAPGMTLAITGASVAATTTTAGTAGTPVAGTWTAGFKIDSIAIDLKDAGGSVLGTINVPVGAEFSGTATPTISTNNIVFTAITTSNADIAAKLHGKRFENQEISGKYYSGKLNTNGTNVSVVFDNNVAITGFASATTTWQTSGLTASTTATVNNSTTDIPAPIAGLANTFAAPIVSGVVAGDGKESIETEKDGDMTVFNASEIMKCYDDGTPIPLTEKGVGADENLNDNGGVQSGKTVYFMIRDDAGAAFERMGDDLYWKLKVNKATNGKYVKAISDVTKIFSNDLYDANKNGGSKITGTGVNRHRYIKVELNEIYTDDEYKIGLDMRLSATQKAVDTNVVTRDSTEIKVKDFTFYMKNIVKDADNDWKVGIGGLMLNPVTNDWNEVTYYDEEGDVAFMKFFGDSDTGKFYAKLSTKWAHEDYAAYFNDQDAFYFEFTGSPNLSSTSRADLQIYNPFVDEDGNETIDPSTATVYQVVDGDLIDVTESFTYGEAENGEDAFITRTRFLGSYIICEKPVEEAAGDADIDDLMPDDLEVPDDITPSTPDSGAGGGKAPANTGRYL